MMRRAQFLPTLLVPVSIAMVGATPAALAQDAPIVLRFAVSDYAHQPSAAHARAFMDEVAKRSGGSITVEPTWVAGAATDPPFEEGVARLLVDGEVELALAAARGWERSGISSLKALQAPFLIADDALALAVAESALADDMLTGMAEVGVTGLSMWYEGLRHPMSFEGCAGPLLAPDDFGGLTIRSIPSPVTWDLLRSVGATPVLADGAPYIDGVASCEVSGAEAGLGQPPDVARTATATGDIAFYPKYQVLAANSAALEQLTGAQQMAIHEAAEVASGLTPAGQRSEVDLSAEFCANGGRVVLAGPDGVAAFVSAAQPIIDRLEGDAATAAAIQGIRHLADTVSPAQGAPACEPAAGAPSASPRRPMGTPASAPPEGTWRVTLTDDEILAAGAPADDNLGGVFTWTFGGGNATYVATYTDGFEERCEASLEPSGDLVRFVYTGTCAPEVDSIQWSLEGDGLHLSLVALDGPVSFAWNKAYLEAKPWQRIE